MNTIAISSIKRVLLGRACKLYVAKTFLRENRGLSDTRTQRHEGEKTSESKLAIHKICEPPVPLSEYCHELSALSLHVKNLSVLSATSVAKIPLRLSDELESVFASPRGVCMREAR